MINNTSFQVQPIIVLKWESYPSTIPGSGQRILPLSQRGIDQDLPIHSHKFIPGNDATYNQTQQSWFTARHITSHQWHTGSRCQRPSQGHKSEVLHVSYRYVRRRVNKHVSFTRTLIFFMMNRDLFHGDPNGINIYRHIHQAFCLHRGNMKCICRYSTFSGPLSKWQNRDLVLWNLGCITPLWGRAS